MEDFILKLFSIIYVQGEKEELVNKKYDWCLAKAEEILRIKRNK